MTQGWQPAPERPFDGHLEDAVSEITRVMYGAPRTYAVKEDVRVGETVFRDAFRASVDGRTVIVSSAWTNIQPEVRFSPDDWTGVGVCAAELPSVLEVASVHPRRFPGAMHLPQSSTGNAAFDERFVVAAMPGSIEWLLTSEVQQRIMAHDDWFVHVERYLLGCISKGPFRSVEEVTERIAEVLAIVAAIPSSVLPDHVDHSADDLIGRISGLTSIDEAMAVLQQLTPTDREQLARSDTPLASFADVRTPQDAVARLRALDPQRKMQLMAMFMKAKDTRGGS